MNVQSLHRGWWVTTICVILPLLSAASSINSVALSAICDSAAKEQPTKYFFFMPLTDEAEQSEAIAAYGNSVSNYVNGLTNVTIKISGADDNRDIMNSLAERIKLFLTERGLDHSIINIVFNERDTDTPFISIISTVSPSL